MIIVGMIAAILLAGCAPRAENRTPHQLLSLSVAGLSGVDNYTFQGTTSVTVNGVKEQKPLSFRGTVEAHNRIHIQTNANAAPIADGHPLELLRQVESTARMTELLDGRSGGRTAVLRIQADEPRARKLWEDRLRGEFARMDKQMRPAQTGRLPKTAAERAAFEREWTNELNRSRQQLERILKTLRVNSVYTLAVDRSRLLPVRLQEHTVLSYETNGIRQHEERTTDMEFVTKRDNG
jgi:hypothetical protein